MKSHDERGFTLIEMLVVLALSAILLTLGAAALRQYWLTQSIDGAVDEVVTQLRTAQERSVSESHPLVYGIRFRDGSTDWDLVRYDPDGSGSCVQVVKNSFAGGFGAGGVQVIAPSFPMDPSAPELVKCKAQPWSSSADQYTFFYARGNAIPGSLTLRQPTLGPSRDKTVTVIGITGRVVRS